MVLGYSEPSEPEQDFKSFFLVMFTLHRSLLESKILEWVLILNKGVHLWFIPPIWQTQFNPTNIGLIFLSWWVCPVWLSVSFSFHFLNYTFSHQPHISKWSYPSECFTTWPMHSLHSSQFVAWDQSLPSQKYLLHCDHRSKSMTSRSLALVNFQSDGTRKQQIAINESLNPR